MNALQQFYRWALSPIANITTRFSAKTRNKVLGCCLFLIIAQCFIFTSWGKYEIAYGYSQLFITNTVLLIVATVASVSNPLKTTKWKYVICIPWFLCSILIIISGIHHNITGALMFFAGLMLLVFPCFFFVWNSRGDYEVLYKVTSKAIIVTMVLFELVHLLVVPMNPGAAYAGLAINPNSIGIASVAGMIASLYLICIEKKHTWIYILTSGLAAAFVYFSASRASALSLVFVVGAFILCYLRSCGDRKMTIVKSVVISTIVIIVCCVSVIGYKGILTEVTPHTKEFFADNVAMQSYAEDMESENENALLEKFTKGDNLESASSGRITIWKNYVKELDFIGHERGDTGLYIEELWGSYSAHNSYLEIAYRSGILAGLCYTLIAIYAAIYAFRFLFGKKLFDYRLSLIPMAVLAFGILSNLERALYPVEKAHIFLFFIALAPMFAKQPKPQEEDGSTAD